jgi:hypothetical protein
MKKIFIVFSFLSILLSCKVEVKKLNSEKIEKSNKVKVLNLGVFHMGETSDAYKTEYDEAKNVKEIKDICRQISKFKPTIIFVEREPYYNEVLNGLFEKYKKNPKIKTELSGNEIQLLGFEIGRLSNTHCIYGFDHQLGYYYDLSEFAKKIKANQYLQIETILKKQDESFQLKPTLKETYLFLNSQEYYDYSININADILTYVNSKDSFEGADEAAKFYQRNLRMFANINKVNTNQSDRILIISGAAHASFLNEFMKRSPKYELEDIKNYLK